MTVLKLELLEPIKGKSVEDLNSWSASSRLYVLFAFGMKVDAANFARALVEADVVEALEACAGNSPHFVIWD